MRPARSVGGETALSGVFWNEPGVPLSERYTPLAGACGLPAKFGNWPARQPTAAITAPPSCPSLSFGWTATSVTTFAKKQFGFEESPAQSPVGRFTFVKLRPASVERNSPLPVAR